MMLGRHLLQVGIKLSKAADDLEAECAMDVLNLEGVKLMLAQVGAAWEANNRAFDD